MNLAYLRLAIRQKYVNYDPRSIPMTDTAIGVSRIMIESTERAWTDERENPFFVEIWEIIEARCKFLT